MAKGVNRRVLTGKITRRSGSRPVADHGVPYAPVPGQLELFEHSQHPEPETPR